MKKLLLTALTLTLLITAFAAPKRYKLIKSTNVWANKNNWLPTGIPNDNDTATIPEDMQLTLSDDLTLKHMYFDLYGSLLLTGNNLKMLFEKNSTINVHTSGRIDGSKASQQIVFNNTILFKGGQTVLTGPKIVTDLTNGFVPYIEFSVLPVTFTSYSVTHSNNSFLVRWTTTDEINAAYYEIQRSTDGASWKSIGRVPAANKSNNAYTYNDKAASAGTFYYRIKQVDADGTTTYTAIRQLQSGAVTTTITAFQNSISVVFGQAIASKVTIEVIGLNGTVAATHTVTAPAGTIQLPATGLRGLYVVRVSNGQNLNAAQQIVL